MTTDHQQDQDVDVYLEPQPMGGALQRQVRKPSKEQQLDRATAQTIVDREQGVASLKRDPVTGRILPGASLNPHGRPRRGESYAEIAANLSRPTKRRVILAMVKEAVGERNVRAAEFLRDTAEGKPAVRVIHEESPALAQLLQSFSSIDADYTVLEER